MVCAASQRRETGGREQQKREWADDARRRTEKGRRLGWVDVGVWCCVAFGVVEDERGEKLAAKDRGQGQGTGPRVLVELRLGLSRSCRAREAIVAELCTVCVLGQPRASMRPGVQRTAEARQTQKKKKER